jgi:hypothetical protein
MNNCTGSGCPDSITSPSAANFIPHTTPPSVAITVPSNGATGLTGSVPIVATCTDAVLCKSVTFYVDGVFLSTDATSPYNATWDSTKAADGSHTMFATATNAGGVNATSPTVTVSTANGISNKTVYLDPTSGTDCPTNTGLSSSSPCSTIAGVNTVLATNPLLGGDSLLMKAGTNLNVPSITTGNVFVLCGPSGWGLNAGCTQNVYPGKQITLGTFGTGTCTVLAGVNTGCATMILTTAANNAFYGGMINISNVPNITVQNFHLIGNQTSVLNGCVYPSYNCNVAINYNAAGGYFNGGPTNTASIQNNELEQWGNGLWIGASPALTNPSSGTLCNATFQNNYIHNASITETLEGNAINLGGGNCGGSSGITGVSFISNYATNTGGSVANKLSGSGVVSLDFGTYNMVYNYNVTANGGYNNNNCGSAYGLEWYNSLIGAVKGNEAYNFFPSAGSCDNGAFDIDFSVNTYTLNYNYGHETWGPPVNNIVATGSGLTLTWGNHVVAYNIFEDGMGQVTNYNSNLVSAAARVGFYHLYNNSVWNGYNGLVVPPSTSAVTYVADWGGAGGYCPPVHSVVANNIFVANSVAGVASAQFFFGGATAMFPSCPANTWSVANNNYYPVGTLTSSLLWRSVNANLDAVTTLSAFNAGASATDTQTNPNFAGTPSGTDCWTPLSGVPGQPGAINCPSAYALTTGSSMIDTGVNLTGSPYNLTMPTKDYFNNTIPNGVGTGYNVGADGAHH